MNLYSRSVAPTYGLLAVVGMILSVGSPTAEAVPFDFDDFIVSGFLSDNIAVFDSDRTFKGFLDTNFNGVSGMDFDAAGRVVATSVNGEVRVYNSAGELVPELSFFNDDLGAAIDLKVGPSGNYYVGTQSTGGGLLEFTPTGETVRVWAEGDYDGVAVLPGGVFWGGGFGLPPRGFINIFDLDTGVQSGTIPLDNGQVTAVSMFYDPNTDTVLTVDIDSDKVYERDIDGNFIRSFEVPDGFPEMRTSVGVTRGPNGDVYATNQGTLGSADGNGVFIWDASGDFVEFIEFPEAAVRAPIGILYTGNSPVVPEPTSVVLLGIGGLGLLLLSRRRTV